VRVNLKDKFRKLKVANPSVKDLRDFGVILGIINALLFGVLFPFFFQFQYPLWPFILSAVLIVCGLVRPKMLRLIYQVWMAIGNCLGWINTRIILGFIFITIFLPTGIIMNLLGKDLLNKKFSQSQESYRLPARSRHKRHFEETY